VTEKAAGATSKVPPVVFEVCESETCAVPAASGVTVIEGVAPQLVNVIELGETVATAGALEDTETTSEVDPVRLQPDFPSPFVGFTYKPAVPTDPAAVRVIDSREASTVASRLLAIVSAKALVMETTMKNTVAIGRVARRCFDIAVPPCAGRTRASLTRGSGQVGIGDPIAPEGGRMRGREVRGGRTTLM
jgi:hypothetical protein